MRHAELPYRYATALFLSADDQQTRHAFGDQLFEFSRALKIDPQLKQFIETPLITAEKKEQLFNEALKGLKVSTVFCDFVRLLAAKGRLVLIQEIAEAYQAKIDELDGIERGHVRSAGELSENEKNEIKSSIEKYCHAKVELDYAQDAKLLGGMIVQVGSLTFDDSLSSHLNQIKEELTRGALNQ